MLSWLRRSLRPLHHHPKQSQDIIQQIYLRQLQIALNPQQPPPPQPYLANLEQQEHDEPSGYRIPESNSDSYVLSEPAPSIFKGEEQTAALAAAAGKKKAARGRKN